MDRLHFPHIDGASLFLELFLETAASVFEGFGRESMRPTGSTRGVTDCCLMAYDVVFAPCLLARPFENRNKRRRVAKRERAKVHTRGEKTSPASLLFRSSLAPCTTNALCMAIFKARMHTWGLASTQRRRFHMGGVFSRLRAPRV